MFGSLFLKLFLKVVFENTNNTILNTQKNCFYILNLMFSMFSMFFRIKKNYEPKMFSLFSLLP